MGKSGFREQSLLASALRQRLPGLDQIADDSSQAALVCGRQVPELVPESCDDVIMGLHRDCSAFAGQGDARGPPVVRVAGADDQPSLPVWRSTCRVGPVSASSPCSYGL